MTLIIKKIEYDKKIEIVHGLFNESEIDYLHSPNRNMSYGWKSASNKNYDPGHWNCFITGYESVSTELENQDQQYNLDFIDSQTAVIWKKIKRIFGERNLLRCYFNGYTYGTEGYIHTDQVKTIPGYRQETILIYCTKEWHADWAGETQFLAEDQQEIVYSTLPLSNRIVCFDSSIPHVGRSVSRRYQGLRTILAFKTSVIDIDETKCIQFIQEKTKSIPHSHTTFFEHLYGTYNILKSISMPQYVCIAGLFHAIYGTEYFKHDLEISRDDVIALIGKDAEHLVYTYSSLNSRTPAIKNNATENPDNLESYFLACIEFSNLLEQAPRLNSTNLNQDVEELRSIIFDWLN